MVDRFKKHSRDVVHGGLVSNHIVMAPGCGVMSWIASPVQLFSRISGSEPVGTITEWPSIPQGGCLGMGMYYLSAGSVLARR